jgi:hypothetical protein
LSPGDPIKNIYFVIEGVFVEEIPREEEDIAQAEK